MRTRVEVVPDDGRIPDSLRKFCPWNQGGLAVYGPLVEWGFAASSTVHLRFQQWRADGVFERLWRGLIEYDVPGKRWMGLIPLTEAKGVPVLTEGHGIPIGVAVDGANRHDMKLVRKATMIQRPEPTADQPQNM